MLNTYFISGIAQVPFNSLYALKKISCKHSFFTNSILVLVSNVTSDENVNKAI